MNNKIFYENLNINDRIWIIGSLVAFVISMTVSHIVKNQFKKRGFGTEQRNTFGNLVAIATTTFSIFGIAFYVNSFHSIDDILNKK